LRRAGRFIVSHSTPSRSSDSKISLDIRPLNELWCSLL
jgi:hypothetical protein